MCGQFAIFSKLQDIINYYNLLQEIEEELQTGETVYPGKQHPVLLNLNQKRKLEFMQWGLIPFWAKDAEVGKMLHNARLETLSEKPSFKYALEKRRCLIPANGFFEWTKSKKKHYFQVKDKELISFAGLWESWKDPENNIIKTFTIITTEANEAVSPIHNRMPVILKPEFYHDWLGFKIAKPEEQHQFEAAEIVVSGQ